MDETSKLIHKSHIGGADAPAVSLLSEPVYNIDDVDGKSYMMDHRMSGCLGLVCFRPLAEDAGGRCYVNGEDAGAPVVGGGMFGTTMLGVFVRKHFTEYDHDYTVRLEGMKAADGSEIPSFEATIHTLPKVEPGEVHPEHDPLVLQAAREGAVLLKNDGVLPLAKGSALNAFGKGVATYRLGCVGAGKINPRYGIRFIEGIEKYSSLTLNRELADFYRSERDVLPPEDVVERARAASGMAVLVISRPTGESEDTALVPGEYYLSDDEQALMKSLREKFEKLVVVLNTGYPVEMGWTDAADAILWTGLNGMAGGRALAEILDGTVSPSGRLPDTWAIDYRDIPSSENYNLAPDGAVKGFPMGFGAERDFNVTVYEEGLYVGYRYFETFGKPVAFPFGHGLSYTAFTRECVRFENHGAEVEMDVRVTNTGSRPGKESVLLFAELPQGKLEQPSRRLVDFAKTDTLAPGACETLHLKVTARGFDSYDEETASWIVEPGTVKLYLGGSVAEAAETASFEVPEKIVVSKVKNRVTPPIEVKELSRRDPEGTYPKGRHSAVVKSKELPYRRERERTPEARPVRGEKPEGIITYPMLVKDPSLLDSFVLQMSDYELCRCSAGGRTGWGYGESGFAGVLYAEGALEKYELPKDYYFSDGNNGLNMNDANIGFPVSNVVCATFNERLSYEEGRAIAEEAIGMALPCILAPAANLHRNPLCGRHSEYFSEDPVLAGRMAAQEGRGLQSCGVACSFKHFFANNAEYLRNTNHAIMTERTARELYLRVFEEALQVYMPDTVMTGYNAVNGVWCAEDEELLEGILREEWGFEGYVMSDWGGTSGCAGGAPAQAGLSWVAPGSMDDREVTPILDALNDGRLDRERLRANVRDMLRIVIKYAR